LRARILSILIATALTVGHAQAHGIAGNRYFPGTLTFDDPAVADEWITQASRSTHPAFDGREVTDYSVNEAFARLLTPTLSIGLDTGWAERHRAGFPTQSGIEATGLTLKALVHEDDPHETLISTSFTWTIGGSGNRAVDADGPHTLTPALFAGKGFGDLPDGLSWLRPFGIAAGVAPEFATSRSSTTRGIDPATGQMSTISVTNATAVIHWGFALEFSTLYLTDRFDGRPPREEPLNQLVPLVEFAFDTPLGGDGKTAAMLAPGLSYVAETYQVAAEALLPLNDHAGHGAGFRAQLLFFLDDLVPSLFGQPLLRR
jgi:hypothetical protein